MSSRTLKIALPATLVVVGIVAAALLAQSRSTPERTERVELGPLVEVVTSSPSTTAVEVTGHGQVVPKVTVNVVPQVSGQVVRVHPALAAGGFFAAGEPLVIIDQRDYDLAVDRAEATVARARVNLEREQAEAEVAREEWDALNPGEEPSSGLVVREPQIRQAEAELEAAVADLESAKLNLERTRVSLPFDGVIVTKNVDIGQFVGTGTVLTTVYGTEVVEVRVPLESRELAWFDVPSRPGTRGPEATLSAEFAGRNHTWTGRVTRMEAEVDSASRMIHVVVEVPRPFVVTIDHPALLPGTFVDVTIAGNVLERIHVIPRHAIHDGQTVWVVEDGRLFIREVEVARSSRSHALVSSGLEPDSHIVVSALDAVTDGMVVRAVDLAAGTGDTGGAA